MSRRAALIASAVLVAAGVVVALVVGGAEATAAERACERAERFEALVRADGAAEDVFATLADAIVEARTATEQDPGRRGLLSGLEAVRYALERDDAAAARVGIDVVRAHCGDAA